MLWAGRNTRLAGGVLLLFAAVAIVDIVLESLATGDANQLARGDIEAMLRDIDDHETWFILGNALGVANDAVGALAVAALLYLMFRDRSRLLMLFNLGCLLIAAVFFLAADIATMAVGVLAGDFVEAGGPGGVAAGDPVILQSARAVAAFWALADLIGLTLLGAGLLALGSLLARAPRGEVNPPRWLGGLAILSGLGLILTWIALADEDVGWTFGGIGLIGTMLLLTILGGWLLVQTERRPELGGEARPAAANA